MIKLNVRKERLALHASLHFRRYTIEVDEDTTYHCVVRVMEGFYEQSDIEVEAVDPAHFNLLLNDNEALLSTTFQIRAKKEEQVRWQVLAMSRISAYLVSLRVPCDCSFQNRCASLSLTTNRSARERCTKKRVSRC